MWASHRLLFSESEEEASQESGGPASRGTPGAGGAAATPVPGLVCRGSKVVSTCQLVDMINTLILGGIKLRNDAWS